MVADRSWTTPPAADIKVPSPPPVPTPAKPPKSQPKSRIAGLSTPKPAEMTG